MLFFNHIFTTLHAGYFVFCKIAQISTTLGSDYPYEKPELNIGDFWSVALDPDQTTNPIKLVYADSVAGPTEFRPEFFMGTFFYANDGKLIIFELSPPVSKDIATIPIYQNDDGYYIDYHNAGYLVL